MALMSPSGADARNEERCYIDAAEQRISGRAFIQWTFFTGFRCPPCARAPGAIVAATATAKASSERLRLTSPSSSPYGRG